METQNTNPFEAVEPVGQDGLPGNGVSVQTVGKSKTKMMAMIIAILAVVGSASGYFIYSLSHSGDMPPSLEAVTGTGFIAGANDIGYSYETDEIDAILAKTGESQKVSRSNEYFYAESELSFYDVMMNIKPVGISSTNSDGNDVVDYSKFQAQVIHYNTEDKKFYLFPGGLFKGANDTSELKLSKSGDEFLELKNYKIPAFSPFIIFSNGEFETFLEDDEESDTYQIKTASEAPSAYDYNINNKVAGWHLSVLTKAKAVEASEKCANGVNGVWAYNPEETNPKLMFGTSAISPSNLGSGRGSYLMWINKIVEKGACVVDEEDEAQVAPASDEDEDQDIGNSMTDILKPDKPTFIVTLENNNKLVNVVGNAEAGGKVDIEVYVCDIGPFGANCDYEREADYSETIQLGSSDTNFSHQFNLHPNDTPFLPYAELKVKAKVTDEALNESEEEEFMISSLYVVNVSADAEEGTFGFPYTIPIIIKFNKEFEITEPANSNIYLTLKVKEEGDDTTVDVECVQDDNDKSLLVCDYVLGQDHIIDVLNYESRNSLKDLNQKIVSKDNLDSTMWVFLVLPSMISDDSLGGSGIKIGLVEDNNDTADEDEVQAVLSISNEEMLVALYPYVKDSCTTYSRVNIEYNCFLRLNYIDSDFDLTASPSKIEFAKLIFDSLNIAELSDDELNSIAKFSDITNDESFVYALVQEGIFDAKSTSVPNFNGSVSFDKEFLDATLNKISTYLETIEETESSSSVVSPRGVVPEDTESTTDTIGRPAPTTTPDPIITNPTGPSGLQRTETETLPFTKK